MDTLFTALGQFFTHPAWLLPAAVSVALQILLTHHAKALLPPIWTDSKRDAVIWIMSVFIGVGVFVPTRWAWLVIDGQTFTTAHFVLSVAVALLVIAAMPWIYGKLPAELRNHYSYDQKVDRSLMKNQDGSYL